jgi:hypothetical protein
MAEFYIVYTNIASKGTVFVATLVTNERSEAVAAVLMFDWRDEKACNQTRKIVFVFGGANIS